ncbi:MAG: hypothetical protein FJ014_04670 [Chloroflexi bacterium]|nr:hypothetical protein [Chloroflexota bacterium]
MTTLVKLVSEYYVWLIGACILGILFYIGRAVMAHQEKTQALFTLEREVAASGRLRSIGMVFVLSVLAAMFYFTATYLEPNLELQTESEPSPTVLLQPTPTLTPGPPTPTPTPVPTRTPRLTPTPAEATPPPTPTPQPVVLPNCPIAGARLTYPTVNAVLKGPVEVRGSANIDNFDYYKFEFRHEGAPEWSFVRHFENTVVDGVLGVWDTSALPAGAYTFRLVVVMKDGNYPEPCEVEVTIQH